MNRKVVWNVLALVCAVMNAAYNAFLVTLLTDKANSLKPENNVCKLFAA